LLLHACGDKRTNKDVDTRALLRYLDHQSIQRTVRYTELSLDRFKDFWQD
jgi:type 1 fimbriae regulatory protein FimB/type 1 fimbriae regulatory protein FimE